MPSGPANLPSQTAARRAVTFAAGVRRPAGTTDPEGATLLEHRTSSRRLPMAEVTYEIVEHDGGWAYKVDGVYSEPYPTHQDALAAPPAAGGGHADAGHTEAIEYE